MAPVSQLILLSDRLLPPQLTASLLLLLSGSSPPSQAVTLTVQHLVSVALSVLPETADKIIITQISPRNQPSPAHLNRSFSSSEEKCDGTTC